MSLRLIGSKTMFQLAKLLLGASHNDLEPFCPNVNDCETVFVPVALSTYHISPSAVLVRSSYFN